MGAHTDANGETAALKKRKRTPKDEASPLNKRLRSKSKSTPRKSDSAASSTQVESTPSRSDDKTALVLKESSGPVKAVVSATQPPRTTWKVSRPMGGRVLDIDPIFSPDERLVHSVDAKRSLLTWLDI
jgi:NET1-associated nuclear protein 1 (U3 small nucleolar RNA-associated protein 17)